MPIVALSPSTSIHSCSSVKKRVIGSSSAVIAVGDERQWHDPGFEHAAADFDREQGAGPGVRAVNVSHGDRVPERGGEAARSDAADLRLAIQDRRAFAGGQAAVERQADAAARGAFGKQRGDARVAGEAALLAAATGYRPGESRSAGVGLAGEVVAVERQARLE